MKASQSPGDEIAQTPSNSPAAPVFAALQPIRWQCQWNFDAKCKLLRGTGESPQDPGLEDLAELTPARLRGR
jgi:hypothetical protein